MSTKVKKSYLFMVVFIVIFTKPTVVDITDFLAPLNFFYDILRAMLMFLIPCWYIATKRHSALIVSLVAVYVMLIVSTIINHGEMRSVILSAGTVFACVMFAEICIEEEGITFLVAMKNVFFVYIILNFITQTLFPGGWYIRGEVNQEGWFLGNKNSFIMFMLPYLFCVYAMSALNHSRLKKINAVGIVVTVASTLISQSSTSIVGVAVFLLIFYMKGIMKKTISAFSGVVVSAILFILIVVLNMARLFSFIIVQLLRKDLTMTVRTYVWEAAIEWFKTSPVIGVGNQATDIAKQHMFRYYHPHCTYLYFLVFAGVIGCALFVVYLFLVSKKIDILEKKEKMLSVPGVAAFWSILIIWLTDVYSRPELFFVMLLLASNMDIMRENGLQNKRRHRIKIGR